MEIKKIKKMFYMRKIVTNAKYYIKTRLTVLKCGGKMSNIVIV